MILEYIFYYFDSGDLQSYKLKGIRRIFKDYSNVEKRYFTENNRHYIEKEDIMFLRLK